MEFDVVTTLGRVALAVLWLAMVTYLIVRFRQRPYMAVLWIAITVGVLIAAVLFLGYFG